jgi:hypothetical protein
MILNKISQAILLSGIVFLSACSEQAPSSNNTPQSSAPTASQAPSEPTLVNIDRQRLDIYTDFSLQSDLSHLSENQKAMVAKLIDASKIMDDLFWKQAFGEDKQSFLAQLDDEKVRQFADINYGPWDRLNGDEVFLSGYKEKPLGAGFYPADITKEELNNADVKDKTGLYSLIKRDELGNLYSTPYSEEYAVELAQAAKLLRDASKLADDKELTS